MRAKGRPKATFRDLYYRIEGSPRYPSGGSVSLLSDFSRALATIERSLGFQTRRQVPFQQLQDLSEQGSLLLGFSGFREVLH